jgi:hypothetical protein
MTAKHTPKPWTYKRDYRDEAFWGITSPAYSIAGGQDSYIVQCACEDKEVDDANRTLMAAAPDMFEVLEDAIKVLEVMEEVTDEKPDPVSVSYLLARIRDVLAKAKGEKR